MSLSLAEYSFESPRRQNFSLPHFIISCLLETESPSVLLKLQQSCKYFFAKKDVLVFDQRVNLIRRNGEYFINSRPMDRILRKPKQCWFTYLNFGNENPLLEIRPYIYRLTLSKLCIWDADVSLNDVNFLLSNDKMKELHFTRVNVRDADGTPVPIDYILGKLPNLTIFSYENKCEIYSNEKFERLNSIKFFKKFTFIFLQINHVSQELDAELLGNFVKTRVYGRGEISFKPSAPGLAQLKNQLFRIIDNWVAPDGKPTVEVYGCF